MGNITTCHVIVAFCFCFLTQVFFQPSQSQSAFEEWTSGVFQKWLLSSGSDCNLVDHWCHSGPWWTALRIRRPFFHQIVCWPRLSSPASALILKDYEFHYTCHQGRWKKQMQDPFVAIPLGPYKFSSDDDLKLIKVFVKVHLLHQLKMLRSFYSPDYASL